MCMMCDEEAVYLDYIAYLHELLVQKRNAGEDTAEIEKVLADNGYVNLDAPDAKAEQAVASASISPSSPFSCDPVDE